MGNAASCAPSIASTGSTKVMSLNGRVEIYTRPVRAAELMLENPGLFVCDSSSLKVGHRIEGLSADEELEKRQLYMLLPMELLYSVLTHEEMTSFSNGTSKALSSNKHGSFSNLGKIFPSLIGEFCLFPSEDKTTLESNVDYNCHLEPVERFSKQRSWRPALETIVETPCRN